MEFFLTTVLKLIPFLRVTILIAFTSMALGLIFGTLLAAMKLCRIKIFKTIANLFTTFIRCTPVIVLIFLAYYGLPVLFGLAGIDINGVSKIVFSIIALTMYASGTLSEIIRPAYLSVDKGQMEAALMSALTPAQAIRLIILPQVVKRIIPPMGNEFINLVKDTALARTIAVYEVLWMGEKFIKSKGIIWPLFYTAVFYLVFNGLLTLLFGWIEKKMDYFK